jgi:excisionase family DNA binding protein
MVRGRALHPGRRRRVRTSTLTTCLTTEEVAARLGIGVSTVYHLTKANRLRHLRIGRTVRFPMLAVEECERSVTHEGPPAQTPGPNPIETGG